MHKISGNRIKTAFFLNLSFTVLEFIGGIYVNSIAIISDAVHDLGDSISLGMSWFLEKKSSQRPNTRFSMGYRRLSVIAALINGLILFGGSLFVIKEAVKRIINPEHSDARGMFIFAVIGISVNGYAVWRMRKGKTLNERVVSWHLLEDVLGWVAVLIVSIVLMFWDLYILDPILSLLISLFILWNVAQRLKEVFFVFLHHVPKDLDLNQIEKELITVPYVDSIHQLHVWSLDGNRNVFTVHIKLADISSVRQIKEVRTLLKQKIKKYNFAYATIETEVAGEKCERSNDTVKQRGK